MFVASYAHMQTNPTPGKWVYVDAEKEAADLYILNHAVKQDIVVTQDTGLASMLVSRGVYALSPRGKYYNDDEMNTVLFFRYVSAKSDGQAVILKAQRHLVKKIASISFKLLKNVVETCRNLALSEEYYMKYGAVTMANRILMK
ncbi:DUF188 domain-containing protein [Priestia megaterium]